jgi:hypothetical protein
VSLHTYPLRALIGDYLRAATGLALTATPLIALDLNGVMTVLFGGLALLFLTFGLRTLLRQMSAVETDEHGVTATAPSLAGVSLGNTRIAWSDLAGVTLKYYSTRKDSKSGWMQLILKGAGPAIKIDSTIDGFEELAARAVAAARRQGVELGDSSAANFAALGIEIPRQR